MPHPFKLIDGLRQKLRSKATQQSYAALGATFFEQRGSKDKTKMQLRKAATEVQSAYELRTLMEGLEEFLKLEVKPLTENLSEDGRIKVQALLTKAEQVSKSFDTSFNALHKRLNKEATW